MPADTSARPFVPFVTVEELLAYATTLAIQVQLHRHSYTCCKGGRMGDDWDCRMNQPRPEVSVSNVVFDATDRRCCAVLLQRTAKNIVPWNMAITAALRCNTAIYPLCCGSMFNRMCWLAKEKNWPLPAPQALILYAALASEYALKYCTKPDMLSIHDMLTSVSS